MPLSPEELAVFKKKLGVKDSFYIPNDVREFCLDATREGKMYHEKWNQLIAVYATSQPELYKQLLSFFSKKKVDIDKMEKNLSRFNGVSMRQINSTLLNDIGDKLHQIVGGTADLAKSTKAQLEYGGYYSFANRRGRNIHFGVREHAMAAVVNGIALYDDFIAYDSTFLSFSNYMIPALRMRAMMGIPAISFFTHDSLLVGEDGPTHQPIEQIASLRNIIGLNVVRPCDANELLAGYKNYLSDPMPTAFVLAKQNIVETKLSSYKDACMGGYILKPAKKEAEIVIYASGSEIPLAVEVANELSKTKDVSVVSMPCLEIFETQNQAYKQKVLQPEAKLRVAIEASNDPTWYKYLDKDNDLFVKIDSYAKSGDGKTVYAKAGFNAKSIVKEILKKF